MKVLFVVNDLDFFLSHRLPIAYEATNRGYDVLVASNRIPIKEYNSVRFVCFNIDRSSLSISKNINSIIKLKIIINDFSPDLIHCITLKPILYTNILCLFNSKIRIVNAISGLGYLFTQRRNSIEKHLIKILFKVIIKKSSAHYIFQNHQDLNEFKSLGIKNNYKLIRGSGVNQKELQYVRPKNSNKLSITYTGRILKDKGVLDLIKAVELLPKHLKSKIILNLYGKIDLKNPSHILEEDLKKKLLPDLIIWHGHSNQIKKDLIESHIYCLPSYREGLPKSTIEAMAIGRPIITTNAPGCDDTVIEEYNGFKVPVGNVEMLTEKLALLINDKKLRHKMGKNSRAMFEKEFTLEKVVNRTFELYDKVLKT